MLRITFVVQCIVLLFVVIVFTIYCLLSDLCPILTVLSFSVQPGVIVLICADLLPPYDVSNTVLINCKEKDIRIIFIVQTLQTNSLSRHLM